MNIDEFYTNCRICPRNCGVNRNTGKGFCGENAQLRVGFAGLHSGEEPPLRGEKGSGTVFISGCNLRCKTCQNWQISGGVKNNNAFGRNVSAEEFIIICLKLQEMGAENINIVTGSHVVPAIVQNLSAAKKEGLNIPVVWNTSSYEKIETLELLDGLVDIWLPDIKTLDKKVAATLFNAPDYPEIASAAIEWMTKKGKVIIRHLILPGYLESTRAVLKWLADSVFCEKTAEKPQISIMTQYTLIKSIPNAPQRFVSRQEYETVLGWLSEYGIEEGFCQELVTGSDWLPDFRKENPFSSKLSVPIWGYKNHGLVQIKED